MFVRIILQEKLSVRVIKKPQDFSYNYYAVMLSENEEAEGIIIDVNANIEQYLEDIEDFQDMECYMKNNEIEDDYLEEAKYSYISFFVIKHFKDNKEDGCQLKKSLRDYK